MMDGPAPERPAPTTALTTVSEAVLEVEAEHGLLALRVDGAPFWQRVRFEVHRQLLVGSGAMGPPERAASPMKAGLGRRLRTLRASVGASAFVRTPRCDALFVGGGRRVHDPELGWYSPYYGLVAQACGLPSLVAEFHTGPRTAAAPGVTTRYLDRLHVSSLPARVLAPLRPLPHSIEGMLGRVESTLLDRTGVQPRLVPFVQRDLAARRHELPAYRRLLERSGAKIAVVECSYDKHALLEAAREAGVPVIELQHGVLGRHHFGYHFPRTGGVPPLACDWLLTWGEYWRTAADLPLPPRRILAVGFPRFDREQAGGSRAQSGHMGPDTILFLSQAMLGETLSRFAAGLAGHGLRDRILFRLHPRDEDGWHLRYPWLREAGIRVCGSETPLYSQLAAAPALVGTFSTALFEGLALGGRLHLVPAPGIEYMEDLVRSGHAVVTPTPEDLAARLRRDDAEGPATRPPGEHFFRAGALARCCTVIRTLAAGGLPGAPSSC